MRLPAAVYRVYEARLRAGIPKDAVPAHIGVILDGNRRWARMAGTKLAAGHKRGADKIAEFLSWSEEMGVELVTLWMLSTDNLERDPSELADLVAIIEDAVEDLAEKGRWRLRVVGASDLLPYSTVERLAEAEARTAAAQGMDVNVAVGYGGRREIADAVKELLREKAASGVTLAGLAETIDVEQIADHLYTRGQPDPDLVIRTSGEQRLSGFLLWQSVHSEFYFCEAYWPDFRRVDFLRALRSYAARERRRGR
ncbi:MAG: isoprenyl transferase [Bifidobacteriaceae bacterium]|jgi:short-chain Z-isoprenyl diphosphate synthase|nr:isoprenyl transferase [Bifidobacteriaceae bacterium]